jgi:hypothetical protein
MEKISLDLTTRQISRLRNGHAITVKPEMVGKGMDVMMSPTKIKRIHSAGSRSKGCRCAMSPEELEASGGKLTFKKFKEGLKKGWKGYQKYAKPIVSPIVRAGLKLAIKEGVPAAAAALGQPELAVLAPAIEEAAMKIGDVTKAYGVKKPRKRASVKKSKVMMTGAAVLPASHPLVSVGNLQYGQDLIKGNGVMKRHARFNSNLADPELPASKPLIEIGNPQYGNVLLKGGSITTMGYGMKKKGKGGYIYAPRGGLLASP